MKAKKNGNEMRQAERVHMACGRLHSTYITNSVITVAYSVILVINTAQFKIHICTVTYINRNNSNKEVLLKSIIGWIKSNKVNYK